jgi:hypothetical protein
MTIASGGPGAEERASRPRTAVWHDGKHKRTEVAGDHHADDGDLFTAACAGEPESDDGSRVTGYAHAGDAQADADAAAAGHDHAVAEPGTGLTLVAIMQKLGADLTALTHGIITEDSSGRAQRCRHGRARPIAPEELERIHRTRRRNVGVRATGRGCARSIGRAARCARTSRMDVVLERLHDVQRGCVACHTRSRERLRTNPPR